MTFCISIISIRNEKNIKMKKGNVGREGNIELNLKIIWALPKKYVSPCGPHLNSTWDPHEQCAGAPRGTRVNSARPHMNSAQAHVGPELTGGQQFLAR